MDELPLWLRVCCSRLTAHCHKYVPLMSVRLMSHRALCSETWIRRGGQTTATSTRGSRTSTVMVFYLGLYALQRTQSCQPKDQFSSSRRHTESWWLSDSRTCDWHSVRLRDCFPCARRLYRHANYVLDLNLSVCSATFTSSSIHNQRFPGR